MLGQAGWSTGDGSPMTKWVARDAAKDVYTVLRRLGALARDQSGDEQPMAEGALFARAALRTWPA